MSRVEKYVCDMCGADRTGIVGIPPKRAATSRNVDACERCIETISWLLRTDQGKSKFLKLAEDIAFVRKQP